MNPKVSLCAFQDEYDWILPWAVNQRNPVPGSGLALNSQEIKWRDIYHFLRSRGLELRPRFNPGWIPSWLGTDREEWNSEDGIMAIVNHLDCFGTCLAGSTIFADLVSGGPGRQGHEGK